MSKIKLGTVLTSYENSRTSLLVGDVIMGGGYPDPDIVANELELTRKFRYAPRYQEYLELLRKGGALVLAGDRVNFNDWPTLALFDTTNPANEVTSCHPLYDYVYESPPVPRALNWVGFSKSYVYTYGIRIRIKEDIKAGDTLILPRPSGLNMYINFGILFTIDGLPEEPPVPKEYITGLITKIEIKGLTHEEIYQAIINDPIVQQYYRNAELYIKDDYLFINSPELFFYYDFCDNYCKSIEYLNDIRFTQDVYYWRGLQYGCCLKLVSKFLAKEGRDIYVTITQGSEKVTIRTELLDESYTYIGTLNPENDDYLMTLLADDPFVEVAYCQPGIMLNGRYRLDSYYEEIPTDETLINGYNSFIEYETPVTALMTPDYIDYQVLNQIEKTAREFTSTILIQADDLTYLQSLRSLTNYPYTFYFSGGAVYQAAFEYITKWIESKNFSPDAGCKVKPYLDNTFYREYNGYEIIYIEDADFITSLIVSNVISNFYNVLYPGITVADARRNLQMESSKLVQELPRLVSVNITRVEQSGNTLYVDVDISYTRVKETITVNFKLYKSYSD